MARYKLSDISADCVAGITVAVMLVPQSMAYAMMAGLDPVVGLYASTIPLIVYALFGSSRYLAVGPVAMISLLVFSTCSVLAKPGSAEYYNYVLVLTLMVGVTQVLCGIFRLGFLVNFFSESVIHGFTSAAAIIIGVSQLKHLLGISLGHSDSIVSVTVEIMKKIDQTNIYTFLVGIASVAVLLFTKKRFPLFPASLLVVVVGTVLAAAASLPALGVKTVGIVPRGFPPLSIPSVEFGVVIKMIPAAVSIFFIGYLESIAIAKVLAEKAKCSIDSDKELVALGMANTVSSFFSGYSVTGGLSRSAVNYQAGARTQVASVVTGILIIVTLLYLTPLFYYLPNSVLAAIVIVAVYSLVDLKEAYRLYVLKKSDGWIFLITFLITIALGVEVGIISGFVCSLIIFIWRSSRPIILELGYLKQHDVFRPVDHYQEAQRFVDCCILRVDRSIYFANMSYVLDYLHLRLKNEPHLRWVIIDMSGVNDMDAMAIRQFTEIFETFKNTGPSFMLVEMNHHVQSLLQHAGILDGYGRPVHYFSIKAALTSAGIGNFPKI
ncbi:MAG: sulfate permease [Chitinivibrionales bacterium]|nr:sulfate permease [Chitinivibrionales bacterium]